MNAENYFLSLRSLWFFMSFMTLVLFSTNVIGSELSPLENVPTAYKGRFRPADVAAEMWLAENIPNEQNWQTLWEMHFLGHKSWDDKPLFEIQSRELKNRLGVAEKLSYDSLVHAVYGENNRGLLEYILPYFFLKKFHDPSNRSRAQKWELSPWFPGLWLTFRENNLEILEVAPSNLLKQLKAGMRIGENVLDSDKQILRKRRRISESYLTLVSQMRRYEQLTGSIPLSEPLFENTYLELKGQHIASKEIALAIENQFPLYVRLEQAGADFKMLPSRISPGLWYSLKALTCHVYDPIKNKLVYADNFTPYTEEQFNRIRARYLELNTAMHQHDMEAVSSLTSQLSIELIDAYTLLAGTPYRSSSGKALHYPTFGQLRAEGFYHRFPLVLFIMIAYGSAILSYLSGLMFKRELFKRIGYISLCIAFALHTLLLALRCYVMGRPPVSNMAETIIYVPWIAVLASIFLRWHFKHAVLFLASSLSAFILLAILRLTSIEDSMENVQAVLDSQYWLTIHVLLVVGSYGLYILGGILGHIYLFLFLVYKKETPFMQNVASCILQTLYIGTAMLIPGTILGGVWAAESWGRFWDWDPKEAWAFISICVYLIWIHAFRFQHIANFGLAIGSIAGLITISFTWYGVNYILGTGLHSYGFGTGGELYYYLFVAAELLLIGLVSYVRKDVVSSQ